MFPETKTHRYVWPMAIVKNMVCGLRMYYSRARTQT